MKILIICIMFMELFTAQVSANAGPPKIDPVDNNLVFYEDSGISLLEEWITFEIGDDYNRNALVKVKYMLKNNSDNDKSFDILFLGPILAQEETEIYANKVKISDFKLVGSESIPDNWRSSSRLKIIEPISKKELLNDYNGAVYKTRTDDGYKFNLFIPKGEVLELDIKYISEGGFYSYDEVVNDVFTQLYYLTPAKFWEGDAKVNMEVIFPDNNYEIYSNIDLDKINDRTYRGYLDKIPKEEWYFNYTDKDGLVFLTNNRTLHNSMAAFIFISTFLLSKIFWKKKKWLSIGLIILIIPELYLFRPSYGFMFLGTLLLPVILGIGAMILIIRMIINNHRTKV